MIRNLGAFGLLFSLLSAGCDADDADVFDVRDGAGNTVATAKSLPPGASIEDCLDLSVSYDTGDTSLGGPEAWCPDDDGDGYYDVDSSAPFDTGCLCIIAGTLPAEYVQVDETADVLEDCDDADATVTSASITAYADADLDSYGDASTSALVCGLSSGWVVDNTDCDDTDAAVNPLGIETCNTIDDNCDGAVDDADDDVIDAQQFFEDDDADLYGNASSSVMMCEMPSGYIDNDDDCDDADAAINPDALEVCDGVDNDCDGVSDDDDSDVVTLTGTESWPDADSDGFGDETASSTWSCIVAAGQVEDATDCDDGDVGINPSATEVADDGIDQDCDGSDLVTTTGSATEVCATPISTTDTCSLYLSDYTAYPYTPDDPNWYPVTYATGVGELCAESPAASGNRLKVNVECTNSSDGSLYWGWELLGTLNVSSLTIGGTDVLSSTTFEEWDEDGDGDMDGADGIVAMP